MWKRLKEIVGDVLELPPEQQDGAIRRACGDDTTLLAQARTILRWSAGTDFLDQPAYAPPAESALLTGRTIGPYLIGELIARGGMGAVYRATHERTGQTVALKVLRYAFGIEEWERRFQHEVRILGQLRHPSIAQIHDAGVVEDTSGQHLPYFAMEFVDGVPLTQFLADQGLDTSERIELMIRVCEGVQHAHQHGITHRDLKPDNILVTEAGHPKILDFGVARVTGGEGPDVTQMTEAGQIVGTLAYMSPEQVSGDPDAVDTRTDVYALGVILFEALGGRRPYDVTGVGLPQAIRRIQEAEPIRLASLDRRFAGDLDTITQTALDKDRERRYPSASELAADLRRFQNHEPISARPASTTYQIKKFARRHRGLVAGIAIAFLALTLGFVFSIYGMLEARREKENAEAVATFLEGMFVSADLDVAGRMFTVLDLLDQNAPRIETEFPDQPIVRARLHSAVGWDYFTLRKFDAAHRHMSMAADLNREQLGPEDPVTIAEDNRVNTTLIWLDRLDEAEKRTETTLTLAKRALGPDHVETLSARAGRALLAQTRNDLAKAMQLYQELLDDYRRLLDPQDIRRLHALNALANVYMSVGKPTKAKVLYQEVCDAYLAKFGAKHTKTLVVMGNVAIAQADAGQPLEAIKLYEKVIELGIEAWGEDHGGLWDLRSNLATVLETVGRHDDAFELYAKVHEFRLANLGPTHIDTLSSLNLLCINLVHRQKFVDAVARSRELAVATAASRGADDAMTGRAYCTHANALSELAEKQEGDEQQATQQLALENLRKGLQVLERTLGPVNPTTIIERNNYGRALQSVGSLDQAIETMSRAAKDWNDHLPKASAVQRVFRMNLARALLEAKRFKDSEREFKRALELPEHPLADERRVLGFMVGLYEAWQRPDAAARLKKRLAALPDKT